MSKLVHLTHTGRYAGAPYCGAARGEGEGIHLQSAYQKGVESPQAYIDQHVTCAACRKVYAEANISKVDHGAAPDQKKLF